MTNQRIFDNKKNLIRTVVIDTEANTVTTTVVGEEPVVEPLDPATKASIERAERRQRRAERLETAIESLSGALELTDLDFDPNLVTDNEAKKAVRQLRSRLNDIVGITRDLRTVLRDLVDEDA